MEPVQQIFKPGKRYDVYEGEWNNGYYRYDVRQKNFTSWGYVDSGYGRYCTDMNEVNAYINGELTF